MKVLVIIDIQKDFTTGVLGNPQTAAAAEKAAKKIRKFKAQYPRVPVIYTMDTHDENYLNTQEGQKLPIVHCVKGTDGWNLDEAVKEEIDSSDLCVEKNTFGAKDIAEYIKKARDIGSSLGTFSENIEAIEIAGVCTDICVISNAMIIKAFFPQTTIVVDSECCGGVTVESHENALKAMEACQIDVVYPIN